MVAQFLCALCLNADVVCMNSRTWQYRVVGCAVALGTCGGSLASQEVLRPSTTMVIRQQLGSIADEVAEKLQLEVNGKVAVSVQPSADAALAENAFVEALQRRGFRPLLDAGSDSAGIQLSISVLTDRAQFEKIGPGGFMRTVQTDVEAREENRNERSVAVLGLFHRLSRDTVSQRDAEVPVPHRGEGVDLEPTFFERLVAPLIILASGILVVYLFFTVRS